MTQDLNKRISLIQYNLLNLPQNITFSAGRKLNVTYGSPSKTINYSGNMVYENGTLAQILTEGGYVTLSGTTPTYHAYLRDHQGNNRVVINGSGTIEQVTQYYPFGYFFAETTNPSTQRYKYNDKEFDEMHGLHWYDYGARHYDPAIMRFTTMDPMCEKYYHLSPYAYCGNNPVNAVDPSGMDWYRDNDGTIQFNPNVKSQDDLIKGQTYLWKAKNYSSQGINYRSDGSILYNNETDAYNRMWKQADQHYRQSNKGGREVGGFILSDGKVLVLPDYDNDATTSHISEYGYKLRKDGTLSHGEESFKILANIHTHQDRSLSAQPSFYDFNSYGDLGISMKMGGKPVITIGWDGEIHGIRSEKNIGFQMSFSKNLRQRHNLLVGYTKLSRILRNY